MKTRGYIVLSVMLLFAFSECKHIQYSQSGKGSRQLPDSVTVTILQFTSSAPLAKATLPQTMTESLKDYIVSKTRLSLVPSGGDLTYEGDITGYSIAPVAITAGTTDQAALNRLTITVKVKYTDDIEDKFSFDAAFTRFADFPSSQDISSVEDALIKDITDQITQDIINKSIYAW